MSPKNLPLIVGLAAPGLLWLATSVASGQSPPPAARPTPTLAPTPASPGSTAYKALLLTNGKVVRGEIVEDAAAKLYRLRQRGGSIGYPKIMVQKAGDSLEELYRFQVARLPEGDPDERMKLARWCLTEKLPAQAREQLEAVQAMCPDDAEAKGMLYNLAATTSEKPPVDADLRRTSGEMPDAPAAAPASLDPRVSAGTRRRYNNALPEIFDLPQAQAVKRANEFVDRVQPVLLQRCARCHDEKYDGEFQLVEVKARRDWTNGDVARANLDATLKLVTPDDPARSPLLMAGLMPHAGAKGTIFRGPNDPAYQALAGWAKGLRPAAAKGSQSAARGLGDGQARAEPAPGEGFASERPGRPGPSDRRPEPPLPILPASGRDEGMPAPLPPSRAIVEQIDESAEFVSNPADRPEFPAPFAFGGKPAAPAKPKAARPAKPGQVATEAPAPKAPARTATPAGPGAVTVSTQDPNELPGMDLPRYPPKPEADAPGPASKDKPKPKAKPIDPALLDKMMKSRNGGTP